MYQEYEKREMRKKFYSIPKERALWGLSFRWKFNILICFDQIFCGEK